jgi:hypothetical protein
MSDHPESVRDQLSEYALFNCFAGQSGRGVPPAVTAKRLGGGHEALLKSIKVGICKTKIENKSAGSNPAQYNPLTAQIKLK